MTPRHDDSPGDSIHPNDRAVLYDLVDGCLAPRAEEEVRRRLDDEPDLRVAYEQIVELRGRLAALPVPALPADFLERVRAKAGFPAAPAPASDSATDVSRAAGTPAAGSPDAGRPEPAAAVLPAGASSDAGGPELGRVLSFARYAYGLAALLVVALGVAYWKLSEDGATSPVATESAKRETGIAATEGTVASRARAERREPGSGLEWKDSGPAKNVASPDGATSVALGGGGGGATPHFGPVGALPPGLRIPSDNPADERPPASPMPLDARTAGAGQDGAAANEGSFAKRKASSADPRDVAREGALAERPSATSAPMDDAGAPPAEAAAERAGKPSAGAPALAGFASPSPDADEDVLYVYADSLDVARAEVSIWVADARAGRTPDARRLAPRPADRAPTSAEKPWEGDRQRPTSEGDAPTPTGQRVGGRSVSDSPKGDASVAAPAAPGERILGAFVVEVDEPAFARLSRSLPLHGDIADAKAERSSPRSAADPSGDSPPGAGLSGVPPAESGAPSAPPMPTRPPAASAPGGPSAAVPVPVVPVPAPGALPVPAAGTRRTDASPEAEPVPASPSGPPPSGAPSDASDAVGRDGTKWRKADEELTEKPSIRKVRIVVLPSR